jgi:hypothetical protein
MSTQAKVRPSVLLIREWEQQMSSSGCCGRLEGDFLAPGGKRCFPERRDIMESMGPLYRELRSRFGDAVEINVVDPRNFGTLLALLARDFRRHRPAVRDIVRTVSHFSVTSVIVNGRLLTRGSWPSVDDVAAALEQGVPTGEAVGDLA